MLFFQQSCLVNSIHVATIPKLLTGLGVGGLCPWQSSIGMGLAAREVGVIEVQAPEEHQSQPLRHSLRSQFAESFLEAACRDLADVLPYLRILMQQGSEPLVFP